MQHLFMYCTISSKSRLQQLPRSVGHFLSSKNIKKNPNLQQKLEQLLSNLFFLNKWFPYTRTCDSTNCQPLDIYIFQLPLLPVNPISLFTKKKIT